MTNILEPPKGRFHDVAEWLRELGDVPPERILMNPWPGTATEADLLDHVEHDALCELIDGTLVEKPMGFLEAVIAARLIQILGVFVYPRNLGIIAGGDGPLRMRSKRVYLPDVSFISAAALPGGILPRDAIGTLPPTIAAEVISPSNTKREMQRKLKEYFESGAQLVWFIYPESRTVAVYVEVSDEPLRILNDRETLDGGTALPGFSTPVSEIFIPALSQEPQSNG